MHFSLYFPYENFKNPLKLLNKKFELAQKLVDFSMHFFRIFPHEIFKDPLKVLNKKLKFGQKISLDFCLYTPSKCPTKNSPACKNKKKLVQKSNIFYVDQGVKSRFPFISKIGGSIKYSCHSLISELSFSTFNLICGFA